MKVKPLKITREAFKDWLKKQPNDRTFYFLDCEHCLIASFFAEALNETVSATGFEVRRIGKEEKYPIPRWLNGGNVIRFACSDIMILKKKLL